MTGCSAGKGVAETSTEIVAETEMQESATETASSEMGVQEVETEAGAGETASREPVTETSANENSGSLKEIGSLLGMQDSDTASMFGGGEENWTEDSSFYIGRIFQVELYGETYSVHTTCSEEGIVESVSTWIVSGERKVEDEETEKWVERITAETGVEPTDRNVYSEGGSRQKTWEKNGKIVTLHCMEDILSISFQNMKGELK